MSVESGFGSSSWGTGKWGLESDVDSAATINAQASVAAVATVYIPGAASISASSSVSSTANRVHRSSVAINATSTVQVGARLLWVPQPQNNTTWTKKVA
mgnify:CR=1 FL=1